MSSASARPPWAASLYTHNPFYALSLVLMLFGVRAGYGELEIGSINVWIMLGVLAGYTLLLAGITVAIVRWGKVWDDARSLLILLLILFLAVSIGADEMFVDSAASTAAGLMLGGFLFSAALSEAVLRAARIRLGWAYRGPYYLMLALFYLAPWWCSPGLHPRPHGELEWMLFMFPTIAAGLFLLLIPAIRRGAASVANNGTPWPWPWFPLTMYGVIAAAVALRSFVLCLTFGPIGPIWRGSGRSLENINFDTIFGLYFLVPLVAACLWLALESTIASGNRAGQRRVLSLAPVLLILALPLGTGHVFQTFLERFVERVASPLWITTGLLILFYGRAWLARVPLAGTACLASATLQTVIGPHTLSPSSITAPQAWPLFAVGAVAALYGVRRRSSAYALTGGMLLVAGLWLVLPQTFATDLRFTLCYHILWAAVVAIGLAFQDRLAVALRFVGAVQMPIAAIVVLASSPAAAVPLAWRILYLTGLAGAAILIAVVWGQRWYLYAFLAMAGLAVSSVVMVGYRQAVSSVGRPAMWAITWSIAFLLVAFLISARKASWLPPGSLAWLRPANGHSPPARPPEFAAEPRSNPSAADDSSGRSKPSDST